MLCPIWLCQREMGERMERQISPVSAEGAGGTGREGMLSPLPICCFIL